MPHRFDADVKYDCAQIQICGACDSTLVQPIDHERISARCWQVELRCPECESFATGVFTDDELAAYDEQFELGVDALLADLRALTAANLEDEIERFAAALHAGLIVAADF